MDNKITYEQNGIDNAQNSVSLKTLPPFAGLFQAIDATATAKTRISYAYDISYIFSVLLEQNPMFETRALSDYS